MKHYAEMDISLDSVSVCVVDGAAKLVREAKIASEPGPLAEWFRDLDVMPERIGMGAGPQS